MSSEPAQRVFVRAEGTSLWDADGHLYLDLLSGGGACPLGHNHPELLAVAEGSLRARSPSFVVDSAAASDVEGSLLVEALGKRLGPSLSRAHLCSSGSEAIDGALKLAYAATRRATVLYCERSYHGTTLGALSVTGSERLRGPFPSVPGTEMVPFGDLDAAERKIKTKRVAAFIVEPIQIEAGLRMMDASYFVDLSALCKRYGTLLIFDETQTAMGYTGTLFAFQGMGITPDVVCFAQALGGGLVSIGGYATSVESHRRAYGRLDAEADHSSGTGTGASRNRVGGGSGSGPGALACAVARRTLSLIDETMLHHVVAMDAHVGARLARVVDASRMVRAVRGKGLMWAVEFASPIEGIKKLLTFGIPNLVAKRLYAQWVVEQLLEKGFVTQTTSYDQNVLQAHAALILDTAEFDRLASALTATVADSEPFLRFARDAASRVVKQLRPGTQS